jgi:rhomboid protease GluP
MLRKKSGSILCPNCGQIISVNAEKCIHCGRRNPGLWGFAPLLQGLLGRFGFAEMVSIVCVIFYAISLLFSPSVNLRSSSFFTFLEPHPVILSLLGATSRFTVFSGQWWTLITAIYLHGNLLHILFNVMWIRQLAPEVEEYFGIARLILIFTIAGIAGFVFAILFSPYGAIGASGSIFGLFGAIVYYGRHRGGSFGMTVYRQTAIWAALLFFMGLSSPRVSNWGHAGGFIGGYLAAMLLGYTEKRPESFTMRLWAMGAVGLTILAFGMVAWNIFF